MLALSAARLICSGGGPMDSRGVMLVVRSMGRVFGGLNSIVLVVATVVAMILYLVIAIVCFHIILAVSTFFKLACKRGIRSEE